MKYSKGYKYQLEQDYAMPFRDDAYFLKECKTGFIQFEAPYIIIKRGYAWDGCSGPTWDDKTNMRASLHHDVLYQLMREMILPWFYWKTADKEFDRIARIDGMGKVRRWYYLKGLRIAGGAAAKPKKRKIYEVGNG